MKVEVQELEPCKRQLRVEAPESEVAAAWEAAYGRVQREARLPGFRRGKVPRTLVRAHFAGEVRRAVAEQLIPDVYRRAVDEARLSPVEEPEVRELQLEEGQPLRFTAVIEIKPAIGLGEYRGVTRHPHAGPPGRRGRRGDPPECGRAPGHAGLGDRAPPGTATTS